MGALFSGFVGVVAIGLGRIFRLRGDEVAGGNLGAPAVSTAQVVDPVPLRSEHSD